MWKFASELPIVCAPLPPPLFPLPLPLHKTTITAGKVFSGWRLEGVSRSTRPERASRPVYKAYAAKPTERTKTHFWKSGRTIRFHRKLRCGCRDREASRLQVRSRGSQEDPVAGLCWRRVDRQSEPDPIQILFVPGSTNTLSPG